MISKNFWLTVPQRAGAPSTEIFIKMVADSEASLKTKPYMFIFPGGPGANHSHYEDYYSCLATHANIVFYDPRGCGLSSKDDPVNFTIDNYIDDIEIVRHQLNLKHIIVLGKSCGAMAAVGFTLRYPTVVSALILAAGAPSFRFLDTAKANLLARGTTQQQEVCEKLWQGSFRNHEEMDDYFKEMASLYSFKVRHGLPVSPPAPPKHTFSYEWLNRSFRGFLREFDVEEQLHLIRCPTLILVGIDDWITDKIHSQLMADKIANSQHIVFPNASHNMEIDVPELYFNAIKEFIRV